MSPDEEWCGVDECPASICGGPHVAVSDGNLVFLVPIVEPVCYRSAIGIMVHGPGCTHEPGEREGG